jgi:hypothetical protein
MLRRTGAHNIPDAKSTLPVHDDRGPNSQAAVGSVSPSQQGELIKGLLSTLIYWAAVSKFNLLSGNESAQNGLLEVMRE